MVLDRSVLELFGDIYGIRSVCPVVLRGHLWY